jgi:hypothetical protein
MIKNKVQKILFKLTISWIIIIALYYLLYPEPELWFYLLIPIYAVWITFKSIYQLFRLKFNTSITE